MTVRTILVVEDNPDEIALVREALQEALDGVAITIKATVGGALEWLAAQTDQDLPELVLTDHHLPDRLGQDLIAAIRGCARSCRLPVVMVSGDDRRPAGIDGTAWYGKPDTWKGWCELAQVLVERHLPPDEC